MMRALTFLAVLMLHACGKPIPPHHAAPSGFFDGYASKWDQNELSVCWEHDSRADNDLVYFQNIVREVVTSQYQRVGFTLSGWNNCREARRAQVRIWVDPYTWPKVQAFGRNIDNLERGMELTFDFLAAGDGWGVACQKPENVANCVRNFALHEFGHALGLKHEADREDSSCEQKTYSPGVNIGAYDKLSIMNYCNNEAEVRANRYPVLSYNDVATLLHVYHSGSTQDTFAAIAWSPSSGAYGSSWRWMSLAAAENTALGLCEQYSHRPNDCRVDRKSVV